VAIRSRFRFELLSKKHDRTAFHCGVEALDRYLREQAGQDQRRNIAAIQLLIDTDNGSIAGYYSLSATFIRITDLPEALRRKFPRYGELPATLLGRLALDQAYQGQGLGDFLMLDSLNRALRNSAEIAAMAAVVDPKDDSARRFYLQYGFEPHAGGGDRLFLPMAQVAKLSPRTH
jgi:GNAT superfamily N-acetyltransferase